MSWPTQQPYQPSHNSGYDAGQYAPPPDRYPPHPPEAYPAPGPVPAPPPARHQGGRGRPIAVVIAVALLVPAVLGSILLFLIHRATATGSPGPSRGSMKIVWSLPAVKGNTTGIALAGSWLTDKYILDGRPDGLVAYAIVDGQQAWGLQPPDGLRACEMSAQPVNGIGIMAYGEDQNTCDKVAAVDVNTGHQLWQVDVADHSRFATRLRDPSVTVSGDLVAVQTGQNVEVFGLTDGKLRWETKKQTSLTSEMCFPRTAAAGRSLVYVLEDCTGTTKLVALSRDNGAEAWQTGANLHESASIAAADPLVLTDRTSKQAYVFANGATPTTIDLNGLGDDLFPDPTDHQILRQHGFAIVGDTLYTTTAATRGLANSVTAIDLTSGRQLWSKSVNKSAGSVIIGADASGVRALVHTAGQPVQQLVTYAAGTGQVKFGTSVDDPRFTAIPDDMLYLTADGHLIDLPAAISMTAREVIVLDHASVS